MEQLNAAGDGKGMVELRNRKDELADKLVELNAEQKSVEDKMKGVERLIAAEQKKLKGNMTAEMIGTRLRELERKRTTASLSLSDEKSLIKQMEKVRSEKRTLEQIESLKSQLEQLRQKKEEITRRMISGRLMRKQVDTNMHQLELMRRISENKGGVVITPDMIVEKIELIPKDRIGQFVGKQGSNLIRLEQAHFVSLDVSNDGFVTITGVEEDVAAAVVAIDEFRSEEIEEVSLTAAQMKMLKSNKGSHLKNIESLLNVSLILVQTKDDGAGVLKMRGLPSAIRKAQDAISEIAAKTAYVNIVPNGSFMKVLFAQAGAELHAIEKVYGVGLHVDREVGKISITGTPKQVDLACQKLQDMAIDIEDDSFEMELEDPDLISVIIGKKGATVRQIQQDTGVNVTIRKPNDYSEKIKATLVLRAPRPKLELGKQAIQKVIDTYARENVTLRFPEMYHSALYGQGGSVIRRIQEESSANITLQRREARSDGVINVFIRGAEEHVEKAVQEINRIIESQDSVELPIQEEAKPALIGQKGAVISKMQKETGANISVQDNKAIIRGTRDQVEAARLQILAALDRFNRENQILLVLSPAIGTLIGKGGSTLRKIRESTGTQIDVSMPGDGSNTDFGSPTNNRSNNMNQNTAARQDKYGTVISVCTVRVRGEESSVQSAVAEIGKLMEDNIVSEEDKLSFREVAVAIPSTEATRKLVGKSGETIRAIESECQVHITVERELAKVLIRGKAGPLLLQAKDTVRDLLEQGVNLKERIVNMSSRLAALLEDNLTLKRIREESGAFVLMEKEEETGKVALLLEGPASTVRSAKEIMAELDDGIERDFIKVSPEHLTALLGTGKPNLDRLEAQYSVNIFLDKNRNLVKIAGKAKDLANGKTAVLRLLRFFFPESVTNIALPNSALISIIIGKKGSTIRKIQQDHNVIINIDRDNTAVDIIGSNSDSVAGATNAVNEIIAAWNSENASMEIPREAIPSIIGKKGTVIQSVKMQSGVQSIDVDRETSTLRIKGDEESLQKALTLVRDLVDKFERENDAMTVPTSEVPWIIGPKGTTIRDLQMSTGASLRIERGSNVLFIQGSPESIVAAKEKVSQLLTEQRAVNQKRIEEENERRRRIRFERQQHYSDDYDDSEDFSTTNAVPAPTAEHSHQVQSPLDSSFLNGNLQNNLPSGEASPTASSPFSYISRLTIGTPVELDTTRLRHNFSRNTTTPFVNSNSGAMNSQQSVSGSDVMSMLLGVSASNNTNNTYGSIGTSGSSIPPGFHEPGPFANSQQSLYSSQATSNTLPDLTSGDFNSFLTGDPFAPSISAPQEFTTSNGAQGFPFSGASSTGFYQSPLGTSELSLDSTLDRATETQAMPATNPFPGDKRENGNSTTLNGGSNSYYTGEGGYTIRLS